MTRISSPRSLTVAQRQARRKAWLSRRRLLVQVRPLALAAAVALGAVSPMVMGQTVITPLQGAGQTNTVVSTQGKQTTITTQSLRDGNAFSTYSNFVVGQGDQVKMLVPLNANWWVNIVRDAQVRVDGRLESRLANGQIGGNLLFIDSHGFAVGPKGQIDTGRLTFAAPSTAFVDGLLGSIQNGGLSGASVGGVLGGQFERSATGSVNIQGRINAAEGLTLMAGHGGTDTHAVTVSGQVVVNGRVAGSAVNLGDLKSLTPLQDVDGVIDITTPGSVMLNGMLLSDSAQFTRAGAVRVVAGQDIAVTANAKLSASGAAGSGQAGGQVTLMAHRDIANQAGAQMHARGDGAGAGGAIEYSGMGHMLLDGMRFDAGSQSGVSGQILLDPAVANITGTTLTNGTNISYTTPDGGDTVTVRSGAIINTRKVADGQDATNATVDSTGNSGKITITAPNIVVESGAVLDASVKNSGGTTYTAGDINFNAEQSSNWATFVALSNANTSIDVAGTLKGRDINLYAFSQSKALFGGVASSVQEKAVDLAMTYMQSPLRLSLTYVEAKGNAKVDIQGTASIQASNDLFITAKADRYAGAQQAVGGSSLANLGAGFAQLEGTTQIEVKSGATLTAGNDMNLTAASKSKVLMSSKVETETNPTTGAANIASVVFAGSRSDVNTAVKVNSGATLNSGQDMTMEAYHSGQYNTAAEVKIYGGGTAGVVGALSLVKSDTRATLDGSATVGGVARVTALNFISKGAVSAKSSNSSEPPPAIAFPETLELSNEEAKKGLFDGFVSMADKLASAQESASGNSSSSSTPKLRMAGALAWSESDHTAYAGLGSGASLVVTGHAIVDSHSLAGAIGGVAMAETTSKTTGADAATTSISAAFNYGKHTFNTTSKVGTSATLTGSHVAVNAATDMPEFFTESAPIEWDDPFKVYANLYGIANLSFLDAVSSKVGAKSSASGLAASGAVSLHFVNNNTTAWVDKSAQVTATTTSADQWRYDTQEVYFDSDYEALFSGMESYRLDKKLKVIEEFASATREVVINGVDTGVTLDELKIDHTMNAAMMVKAKTHVQTIQLAGGEAPESSGSGTAVGGTFTLVDRANRTISGIADNAVVSAKGLDVLAYNKEWSLTVAPTAGAGEGIAANAMVAYNKLGETAIASISRQAQVTVTDLLNLKAELALWSFGIVGAVTKSSGSGVGIGLSMNEISGNTKAYIGDNDSDAGGANTAEGAAGFVKTGQLNLLTKSTGKVGAVGIAGAMAGGPAKPAMANKADAGSSGSQAKAGGGSASPLAAVTGGLQGQGAASGGDSGGASTPPKFSVAGAGAIVTNFSDIDTTSMVEGAVIQGVGAGTTKVVVRANQDLTQVSVAGGGALTMASNPTTSSTTSIAGAVAIQKSDDDTIALIRDSSLTQLADVAGALQVQALKAGERTAVATGISANLSKTTTSDMSIVGSVSITNLSDDTQASIQSSTVTGNAVTATALDPAVMAYDRSRIGAGGGALSLSTGKGSAGVGATVSVVDLEGSTDATIVGGSMTRVKDVSVAALSSHKIVAAGAVAGVQTDSTSVGQLMGAFVINDLSNTMTAAINGGAVINSSGNVSVRAGGLPADSVLDALLGVVKQSEIIDFEMQETDNNYSEDIKVSVDQGESVLGVAGTLSLTAGKAASSVGLSYVQNRIQTTYSADLNGNITATGNVELDAWSRANIVGVAAGLGATKGKFSGMGSASVNLIGQRTSATVSGGTITAATLDLDSDTKGNIFSLAGNLSIAVGSGSGNAAGGAVSYTQTGTQTYTLADSSYTVNGQSVVETGGTVVNRSAGNAASITGATINLGSGDVNMKASNRSDTQSVAASGAFSDGQFAFTGTATWNEIGDQTDARISGSNVTAGDIKVQAGNGEGANSAKIFSLAGGAAASSSGSSVALAFGFNTIESSRSAQILNSVLVPTGVVSVLADAGAAIQTISATIAASAQNSAGGSSSTNWLNGSTTALVDNVTFNGSASSLILHASNSGKIESLAGAVAGGGSNVIGGAVAINLMGEGSDDFKVTAKINNSRMNSATTVLVDADLTGEIKSIAAAGGGSGSNAINGSVTRNLIAGDVTAEIAGLTQNVAATSLIVQADQTSNISSLAGVINGGGANAVGGAISVNDIAGTVTAKLGSSSLKTTGSVRTLANMDGNIQSVAAAGSGAGTAAVNGSNTTNSLTSTVRAIADNVTQTTGSSFFEVWAHDASDIDSFAGTVSGGGTAAVGAALALNFMGRTAGNESASKIVSAEVTSSSLQVSGAVQVTALSLSTIEALGVAAGGGGTFAVTGSNTTNILDDSITAKWVGSTLVGGSGSLDVTATDTATVRALAGNFAGGGAAAVGAALSVNKINTGVNALVQGTASGKIATGDVRVHADSDAVIDTVAVGMSASGTVGVQGSVSVSQIGTSTLSLVNSNAVIEATDSVAVTADSNDRIKSLAGAIGLGATGVGAAGGVLVNMITSSTTAGVDGSGTRVSGAGTGDGVSVLNEGLSGAPDLMNITEVTDTALSRASRGSSMKRGVTVQATSVEQIAALTTVVGGGTVGIGGSVNVDSIDGSTRAYVDSAQINSVSGANAAQEARVLAADHALIASTAATVAGGVATGVAGAVGSELIKRSTTAEVIDSATVNAQGNATVKAVADATVAQIAAGAGVGGTVGVAGSGNVVLLQGNTQARVLNSSVNATDVSVLAEGANRTNLIAGSIGAGGVAGVGLSFTVNVSGATVKALVTNSAIRADGDVNVRATNVTQELAASATAGGGLGGVAIGAAVTVLEGLTEASISGTSSVDSRLQDATHYGVNSLTVAATETVDIRHNAGAAGGGYFGGVGTAANVLIGKSRVIAGAAGSSLKSEGALSVAALREADIDMITVTVGGGGLAGISGAVGVLIFGAAPNSDANSEVNSNNGTMSRVSAGTQANKVEGTGSALSDADKNSLNSNSSYNTQTAYAGASGAHSTSATLSASSVTAGSVAVSSLDKTEVLNNAGSLAVGGVGLSAGVALTTLGGANNASISAGSLTSAGGVSIDAGTRELHGGTTSIQSRAIAGAGGIVGLGAAVSLAKNETANSASLTGTVSAGGAVNVSALDDTSMRSESYGASVGAVSVGVVIAKAEQTGSVLTQVGGSITGQGLNINAQRDASTNAYAKGGSAGVVSGSGAEAGATDNSSVKVALLSGASLNAGQGSLTVSASSNPYANTEALGISVASGVAIGVSIANSSVASEVAVNSLGSLTLTGRSVNISAVLGAGDSAVRSHATAGAGGLLVGATGVEANSENKGSAKVILGGQTLLSTSGDVSVSAIDSMDANAFSTGIGAGFVGIGVAKSKASSNTQVVAQASQFKGLVGGALQVTATGNESINSEAIAGSGGVVAGAGAESSIDHDQVVTADLGSGTGNTLTVGSYANVNATRQVRYNVRSTSATAAAVGASGAVTHATMDGSATARVLDNTRLVADGLRVMATNDLARTDLQAQNAEGGGGGVISGAGADIYTRMNGDALASVGNSVNLTLEDVLEVRAYNEIRGSSRGQMDVGGAIPIALVETKIETAANADAKVGNSTTVNNYGETHVNALSYIDLEANSVSKTYGLAAAAQGNAYATANVNNRVDIGSGTEIRSAEAISLLAGQDRNFNRNKHFVTARVDLFNHSAIPVSINPDADATANVTNSLTVNANAIRSGATIKLGGIEGSYVVEGKGKVSDWTRDLGEMMGISSEYGSSNKNMVSTASLSGQFEAGFGNKQRLIVGTNGTILENLGDVRYTLTKEDLGASAGAYVARLYDQLARYGDVAEIRAFVEAELSFYFATLIREGLAESYTEGGKTYYVALSDVDANFLNIRNLRAGSGNIELYGKNVTGNANLMARADSEILVENRSPLNLRVFNMTVDANGGFVKYNDTYITRNADIGALNTTNKTTSLTVDSIDTRGGGASQQLPSLTVKNTFMPMGAPNRGEDDALIMTAPDGTSANLYADEMRAPEMRVNGTLYNKLGTINLSNTAGSISVVSETAGYTPRLDGREITVTAGKNFMLSSPSISQSVGGSPESLYAVHYTDDQQRIFNNLGVGVCGSARPVDGNTPSYNGGCVVNGAGGIYASGGIFMGARYLNINGTIQSGQADYNATLTSASVGGRISSWQTEWRNNRGSYLSRGVSSMVQVSGPLSTDSEAEINKQFENGSINATQRTNAINAMAARRVQPIIYFDAETGRLKVAPTNVTGGLVELVGSVINTGGGVIRALDGYARMNIDNQTSYGIDLMGLDTGGDKGVVRITDLSKPIYSGGVVTSYEVTTYEKDANGVFKGTTTDGRAPGARVISVANNSLGSPSGSVKARFNYNPLANSTYSWSAGYETTAEKSYYYQNSSWLGFIPGGSTSWNSVNTVVKTTQAMPEDVFVSTTRPVNNGTFSIQVLKSVTDQERETYYRSWRKCGFLCIKKTYYIQRRAEVGYKYLYTQRVKADHAINVELVGYDTGDLTVTSVGDIRLGGNVSNASGNVSLTSSNGSITQLSGGSVVEGVGLTFRAKTGIGIQAAPINLITGSGSFTAVSDSGSIAFHSNSGPLRINQVSTTGEVWLDGSGDILGLTPGAVHVTGKKVYLAAPTGGIGEFNLDGSLKSTLNIQTQDSTFGGLTARARGGIAIRQPSGNLWVNQVISGGDVFLEAGGDLIDNNRNETRDERTEAELLALWSSSALQGASAETSRQATLNLTRSQYRRYWALRDVRDVVTDGSGNVTSYAADTITSGYRYTMPDEDRQSLLAAGISPEQLARVEQDRTDEVLALHAQFGTTVYQTNNDKIIAAVNTANIAAGKSEVGALSTWSDAELKNPLPKSIFSKSSTSTQTRIEEPNVVGNRVVLRPGGKIGKDDGSVTIPLLNATRLAQGKTSALTDDEKLIIMSAETDDMSLNRDTWTLTVVKKDTFNVLSNRLNVTSNGFVYLGADTTDAYPNGGTANLERVTGTGEIRIKVADSILNAADPGVSVIQGQKAILEAARGAIGSADKPVQLTLANNSTGTLTARAQEGIWIKEIGDMRAADIFTPNGAFLTATGAIIDARPVINYPNTGDRTVRAIEAGSMTLTPLAGGIGTLDNPLVIKVGSGGLNATTPVGYSMYLEGAENSTLNLKTLSSGMDIYANAFSGGLHNTGSLTARRDIFATTDANMDGLNFNAGANVTLSSNRGSIKGIKVSAGNGSARLDADDDVELTSLTANKDVVVTAGLGILATVGAAGRDLSLRAEGGSATGTTWTAGEDLDVVTWGVGSDIRTTMASASTGALTMVAGGNLSLTMASTPNALSLKAGKDMSLLKISSANSTVTLESGQSITLQSATAKGALSVTAGSGISANSLVSSTANVYGITALGLLQSQSVGGATGVRLRATAGGLNVNSITTSAGDIVLDAGALMSLGSVTAPGLLDLSAGSGLSAASLTSTGAAIDVDTAAGLLNISKATAMTLLDAQSVLGALSVGTFTSATALMRSGADMTLTTGTTTGAFTADSKGAASLGNLTAGGLLTADATGAMTVTSATGSVLDMAAGTGLTAGTLTSTIGKIDVDSAAGLLKITSATAKTELDAQAVLGALSVGTFTSPTALLRSGADMTLATGTTTGAFTADAAGAMTVTTARGSVLDLSAGTGLTAGTLTSTIGMIDVDTAAGLLKITSATAKTELDAQAVLGALTVGSFTGATALLRSGAAMTLTTGTTTGAFTADSKGAASLGNLTAGGQLTVDATGAMTVTTARGSILDLSAGTGLTAGTLTSTVGKIDVDSAAGLLKLTTATAKTELDAQAVLGDLNVATFTGATALLRSGAALTLTRGTTTGALTADSKGAASLGSLTAGGLLTADATGAMTVTSARGSILDLSAGTGLTAGTLTSTVGTIDVDTAAGLLKITTATAKTVFDAQAVAGALSVGTFTAGSAALVSGNDMSVTTGTASGELRATVGRNANMASLTSTADKVRVDAVGTLVLTTGRALGEVDLSGAGITATTLTSTNAFVDLDSSLAGSVNVKTATAKTYFSANSYGTMTLGTFGVTAGYVNLISRGAMTLSTGTSTGNMTIDGTTHMALGNLTTSAGAIDALSRTGGITFGTLRANSLVKLRAASAWSNGQAISGTALYASNGAVNLSATSDAISVSTLSGTQSSSVTTAAGAIRLGTVLGFSPASLLTVTAVGGAKTVPVAYR